MSQLGDSFQFVAVTWLALVTGGVAGIVAVRLADGLPALLFALAGGVSADRRDRRRTMVAADLVRGAVLVPVAVVAVTGHVTIWAIAPAGFVVAAASSFFAPAFGAALPALAGREHLQQVNGFVNAANGALMVAGRALAAAILAVVSVGSFFGINALSFFVSAALLAGIRIPVTAPPGDEPRPSIRRGFAALRLRPGLRPAIAMLALGTAILTGVWTVGIAELARTRFQHGPAGLSLLLAATAAGTITAASLLAWRPVHPKVRTSCAAWVLLLPAFVVLGTARSLPEALAATFLVGVASGAALMLLTTAVQESVPDELLGRVLSILWLANAGAKPLGLLLLGPLYAVLDPRAMFVVGGLVAAAAGVAATTAVVSATRAARAAAVG